MSTNMVSHPTTVPGNSSRILSATKSSTYLFLVGVDCLMNVPLTILIPDDQYPLSSVMFITGMSTAAAFQLSSTNVERLRLM